MTHYTYHDNPTTDLDPSRIIVFATSMKGDMRLGFGPLAVKKHGAQKNKPMGYSSIAGMGKSFGIPFKDASNMDIRTLDILRNIDMFLQFSIERGYETFHITDVTAVIPRVQPAAIIRLFVGAHTNCIFPRNWLEIMEPPQVPDE